VHGVDRHGKVGLRKQLKRKDVVNFFANLEPCLIGMEAMWQRALLGEEALGVRPFGTSDGAAVREAVREARQRGH